PGEARDTPGLLRGARRLHRHAGLRADLAQARGRDRRTRDRPAGRLHGRRPTRPQADYRWLLQSRDRSAEEREAIISNAKTFRNIGRKSSKQKAIRAETWKRDVCTTAGSFWLWRSSSTC